MEMQGGEERSGCWIACAGLCARGGSSGLRGSRSGDVVGCDMKTGLLGTRLWLGLEIKMKVEERLQGSW